MTVPHDRLRVTSLTQMPTHNGVAFTADLALDGQHVGTIENNGNGGATEYHGLNSSPFNWRHLEAFVAQCRRRRDPVDEETVLNGLVDFTDRMVLRCASGLRLSVPYMSTMNSAGRYAVDL